MKDVNARFLEEKVVYLTADDEVKVTLNLASDENSKAEEIEFPTEYNSLLDWEKIYLEIMEFKRARGYWNLVTKDLKKLLNSKSLRIRALPGALKVKTQEDVRLLEYIVINLIKKYIDLFYHKHLSEFEKALS